MADVIPQQVGAANVVTTAFTYGGGSWARRWGRQQPFKGTSVSRILAEVRENVYASDANGVPYDADTRWVRCFAASSTGSLNEDELTQLNWMGVPGTLPAGYTARNQRNVGVACDWACAAASTVQTNGDIVFPTVSPCYPVPASPTNFVRSAGGLHVPRANDGVQKWGPWNAGNLPVAQSSSNSAVPALYEYAMKLGPPGGSVAIGGTSLTDDMLTELGIYQFATPGYRSIGCFFSVSEAYFLGTPSASFPTFISSTITLTLGSASRTITVVPGDLSPVSYGGPILYEVDLGDIGSLLPAVGDSPFLYAVMTTTFTPKPTAGNIQGSGAFYFRFAPRVDIPLPFTVTTGNVVAPGGILTGSIPGY